MNTFKTSILLASLLATAATEAATLSISDAVKPANGAVFNIDNYGGLDWSLWKKAGATDTSYNVATNSKTSSSAISDLFLVGSSTVPGYRASTSSSPTWDFSYTGGTSPASGTLTDVNGVFHPDVATSGKGVGLTVTLPTTGTYVVTLFVAGYDTTTQLTATLPGLAGVNNTSFSPGFPSADVKVTGYFTIQATADNANDVLNLQIVNTSNRASSHVMISAVAVQLIPEPSGMALAAVSGALLLGRRRRL